MGVALGGGANSSARTLNSVVGSTIKLAGGSGGCGQLGGGDGRLPTLVQALVASAKISDKAIRGFLCIVLFLFICGSQMIGCLSACAFRCKHVIRLGQCRHGGITLIASFVSGSGGDVGSPVRLGNRTPLPDGQDAQAKQQRQ
ncbi:hypothetical protein I5V61_12235 [Stenotrophomonas maltophilia]|uniref:hypothetical protein n=1 Tax=Stenotrophomonas geniculata TaxID=86188 RepID=UPI0018D47669|nr:hypothetical protein [Stenotrophomonas maltophilia]